MTEAGIVTLSDTSWLRRQTLCSLPTHEVRNNDLITAKNRMVVSRWREEELGGGAVTMRNKVGLCYVNRKTTKSKAKS